MSAAIVFNDLSRWFGEVVALNKVNLQIGSGITGLLGPNGAGKSTFMALCTSQLRPSQGSVRVLGECVWNNYALLRRIGLCPDRENYYEDMTGYEFVYWLTRCAGLGARKARAAAQDSIARVGMTERMHDRIATYSRGMRQRVKLAQSFAHSPEVLFLDEPMTGLDPLARNAIFDLIRDLGREGKTVIVSSHILYEIERVTSNIVLLHRGRVLAQGDVHQVRALIDAHPHSVSIRCAHPRMAAAKFVGEPHIVTVSFDEDGGGLAIKTRDPNAFYDRLTKLLADGALDLESVHSPDDNLQAVFEYLVK
ncbi:MAG: ABC transporter ATP-binding protein [Candidatus Hydrogenedentes bacterium]|nr:ABC transporter ATP-binding protein [Candidatus Hydrogenedentota bacterium]